ncbi:hypothetical protein ACLX1H_007696 [Fusarium chlamydosporum]
MDKYSEASAFRLLDLPNELIRLVGVEADKKDALALSTTCRQLRQDLISLVFSRTRVIMKPYKMFQYTYHNLKPEMANSDGMLTRIRMADLMLSSLHPSLPRGEVMAGVIKRMTSLRSLTLRWEGEYWQQLDLFIYELRAEPRVGGLKRLELRNNLQRNALVECLGANLKTLIIPMDFVHPFNFMAASASCKVLESLWVEQSWMWGSRITFWDNEMVIQIAKAFPRLKSLVIRRNVCALPRIHSPSRGTNSASRRTGSLEKLGQILSEKLPNLEVFARTVLHGEGTDFLCQMREIIPLVIKDHQKLKELVLFAGTGGLVRWKRESNQITWEDSPWDGVGRRWGVGETGVPGYILPRSFEDK